MFEALEKITDPNFLTRIAQKAKMFPKGRVAAFPLIFGAGYLGLNIGDGSVEAAEPEIMEAGVAEGITTGDIAKGAAGVKIPTIGQTAAAATLSKLSGKAGGADPLKYLRKVPRKILSSFGTPTGALAAWPLAAWGSEKITGEETPTFDPKSGIERASAGAELSVAPTLVKWTDKLTKPIKNKAVRSGVTRLLNLGMSPAMAMRVARIASPIGMASLLGEVTYQGGKAIMSESKRIDEIKDPELQEAETENFIKNIKGYAGGGLANLTRTVAPDSGPRSGLPSLYNRARRK